jgi:hypothetical protein
MEQVAHAPDTEDVFYGLPNFQGQRCGGFPGPARFTCTLAILK